VILAARIDRLGPEDKRLLQTAAVIGKDVPLGLLEAIAEEPEEELRRGLERLQAAEFVHETSLYPEAEYTFTHALTHEVTYGGLLQERRRELHARVVGAIERLHPERLGEQMERLAHHAVRGEVWERAVGYLREAGLRAAARGASRDAEGHLEGALGALRHLPEDRAAVELAIDMRLDMRSILMPLREMDRISRHLDEAERLAGAIEDQRRLAGVWNYRVSQCLNGGEHGEALRYARLAVEGAGALGDISLIVPAENSLAMTLWLRGEYGEACRLFEAIVNRLVGDLARERFGQANLPSVLARCILAACRADQGRFEEAVRRAEEALEMAESAGQTYSRGSALMILGWVHERQGNLAGAVAALERSREIARATQMAPAATGGGIDSTLAAVYARTGQTREALELVGEWDRAVRAQGAFRLYVERTCILAGTAYLLAGYLGRAREWADEGLRARERGARAYEGDALHLLGEIAAATDPPELDRAEVLYREALALAGEKGFRPLAAHCHLSLGRLFARTARRREAEAHLTTGAQLYRELDMRFWPEQAEAALRALT
jgi:tetratricopeptide (TPR) repeat protein